jgi:hypothetical protein
VPAAEPVRPRPVVGDLQEQRVRLEPHAHRGSCIAGVLERIGQRLLDDAVGGQLDTERQGALLALDVEAHRETGVVHGRDELLELVEPWLRREAELVARVSQHPDEATHLDQRLATRLLDGTDRLYGRRTATPATSSRASSSRRSPGTGSERSCSAASSSRSG